MPSHSEKQRHFFGLVRAVQKGEKPAHEVSPEVRKVAGSISAKDAGDFASSIAELKIKKAVLSILKDCREPMYLNEEGESQASIEAVASTFHVKKDWATYIKPYIGQPFSSKDLEAIQNFKDKHATTITRTELWYQTTDSFNVNKTTVIKKMKDGGQLSFTAFQKQERPDPSKDQEDDVTNSLTAALAPVQPAAGQQPDDTTSPDSKEDEKDEKDDIMVTKSILFKDDIKGAAILIEFLKKLEL